MDKSLDISVVVPLYNERESLAELVAWIDRVARENNLSYEIIMVDDGSRDGSWQEIERLSALYPAIRAIRFARNYGKSAALYCGFDAAVGEVVFTMDADLQDSPDEIPEMRRMILEDWCRGGRRSVSTLQASVYRASSSTLRQGLFRVSSSMISIAG